MPGTRKGLLNREIVSRRRYWEKIRYREEFLHERRLHLKGYVTHFNRDLRKVLLDRIGSRILDMGAGNRRIEELLRQHGYTGLYHSFDVNREVSHEYYSLEEITGQYDTVFMFELIQHLTLEEFDAVLNKADEVLSEGGHLFISTPNPGHFNQLWRTDMTHITPYPLHDLYAELRVRSYACEMFYLHQVPERMPFLPWVRRMIYRLLVKFLYVDPAEGIMVIGKNLSRDHPPVGGLGKVAKPTTDE